MSASQSSSPPANLPDPPAADIRALLTEHAGREGPLLPMLHTLQENYGCVPAAAHGPICDTLNITRAELHGVISFYHDFRDAPAAPRVVKICRSEACQAVGAEAMSQRVLEMLGVDWGGTTADGSITVEPVYCLGLCACGPAALVDGAVRGRVDADALVAEVAR